MMNRTVLCISDDLNNNNSRFDFQFLCCIRMFVDNARASYLLEYWVYYILYNSLPDTACV